jgi:hypothetical protein
MIRSSSLKILLTACALCGGASVALIACRQQAPAALEATPPADDATELFAEATLAPVGSFEYQAAPLYTRNAANRHKAAVQLRHHRITAEEAQLAQNKADQIRLLLDRAIALCKEDDHTGQCTGDAKQASGALAEALVALQ